jgi:acyl-CoA reductase-like NAD-dependent aldehyde dehydrogenase
VSKRTDLPKRYGLRHRAAVGLTEKTDAMAIVVSEETGKISVAKGETIQTVTQEELRSYLLQMFGGESNSEEKKENNSDKNK